MADRYIIASNRLWHEHLPRVLAERTKKEFSYISEAKDLSIDTIDSISPRMIFFPHWSTIIPKEIFSKYECIVFHATDLPFGRGGSPIQNLIVRGIKNTKISAIRVIQEIDAGDIYLQKPLSLEGSAFEIFKRASKVVEEMIEEIITKRPKPTPQTGVPTIFTRRTPAESRIDSLTQLEQIYDYIRMLDAPGYPHAFLETDHFRLEFTNATYNEGSLSATVKFIKKG